ncbi:hypothetical protein LAZ67_12003473 [Cordylochernes scorpioides]|uniref:Transposase n=1 Tax=Cordylochernes scorpioides TaxID=51811 RepID=A0ABY6L4V2_9ARAC|nr:hypothetical protein LAZ67_12003473 [Cordylochernes scorpioides]
MMQTRKEICLDLIESYPGPASEAFKGVITCDETRVYHYDPSSKRQSMQWGHIMSPVKKKKTRLSLSEDKIMITVFWDQDGLILMDMLEKNTSINKKPLKPKHFWSQRYSLQYADEDQQPETRSCLAILDLSRKWVIKRNKLNQRLFDFCSTRWRSAI